MRLAPPWRNLPHSALEIHIYQPTTDALNDETFRKDARIVAHLLLVAQHARLDLRLVEGLVQDLALTELELREDALVGGVLLHRRTHLHPTKSSRVVI